MVVSGGGVANQDASTGDVGDGSAADLDQGFGAVHRHFGQELFDAAGGLPDRGAPAPWPAANREWPVVGIIGPLRGGSGAATPTSRPERIAQNRNRSTFCLSFGFG